MRHDLLRSLSQKAALYLRSGNKSQALPASLRERRKGRSVTVFTPPAEKGIQFREGDGV